MEIDIEEFDYADFLQLPEKTRCFYFIIDLLDEDGKVWYGKPPAARIKAVKWWELPESSWENLYLDFYNLNTEDRQACYRFIIKNAIMYVSKRKYDESKALIFTVNDLLSYHSQYKKYFDFLIQKGSAEKVGKNIEKFEKLMRNIDREKEAAPVFGGYPLYAFFNDINKHLERCRLKLLWGANEGNLYYYKHNIFCEDFLALCYFQLVDTVINDQAIRFVTCERCGNMFTTKNAKKKYCDKRDRRNIRICQKLAGEKRRRERIKADPQKQAEYREYMKQKQAEYKKLR